MTRLIRMARHAAYLALALLPTVAAVPAFATEGGGGAYANGSEGFMTGALPPPGTYVVSYNTYYEANSFTNSAAPFKNFSVQSTATIMRAVHVTDTKILGGNWAMHAFLVYADVNVKNLAGRSQHRGGMGDFIFDPIAIGWHQGDWHWVTGMDIYLPTGAYDKNNLANSGRHYITLEPLFGFTYLNGAGTEFSMKTMFDYNFRNTDTDYRSGQELHADFVVARHFGNFAVGVGGYVYRQVSGDSGSGATLGEFKGRAIGLGPQLSYTTASGLNIAGRWQREFKVENRPVGSKFWINLSLPL